MLIGSGLCICIRVFMFKLEDGCLVLKVLRVTGPIIKGIAPEKDTCRKKWDSFKVPKPSLRFCEVTGQNKKIVGLVGL